MKNIEYLEQFFIKHRLSGVVTVKYTSMNTDDENMSYITLGNGKRIHISDVVFDIDSSLDPGVAEQWMERRRNGESLMEWMQRDNGFVPDVDKSSSERFRKEIEEMVEGIKQGIDRMFTMQDGSDED